MRRSVVVLVLVLSSSIASGQPSAVPPTPPPPPPGAPAETGVDEGVIEDANSGRNWLTPTALTPPAGTWSFSSYELFFASLGYAVTDRFTVSGTFLLPAFEDMPLFGIASVKGQVIKSGNVRGALQFNVMFVSEDDSVTVANLGGVLTMCIDHACHSHLSGYLGAGFGIDVDESQSSVPFVAAAAAVFRVGRHMKFVFEADTAFIVGEVDEAANGFLGWYGIRFTSKHIGVDLGFAKPICEDCEIDELPMGIPFVSFTYRGYND